MLRPPAIPYKVGASTATGLRAATGHAPAARRREVLIMARLEGKVALISGGARGQGAVEARMFAEEGAKVIIGDILDDAGRQTEAQLRELGYECTYVHLDVTSETDWDAAVQTAVAIPLTGHPADHITVVNHAVNIYRDRMRHYIIANLRQQFGNDLTACLTGGIVELAWHRTRELAAADPKAFIDVDVCEDIVIAYPECFGISDLPRKLREIKRIRNNAAHPPPQGIDYVNMQDGPPHHLRSNGRHRSSGGRQRRNRPDALDAAPCPLAPPAALDAPSSGLIPPGGTSLRRALSAGFPCSGLAGASSPPPPNSGALNPSSCRQPEPAPSPCRVRPYPPPPQNCRNQCRNSVDTASRPIYRVFKKRGFGPNGAASAGASQSVPTPHCSPATTRNPCSNAVASSTI